ncbi:MAG: hypothetical protein ACE5J7_04630 [Candidatus Aenigmatarchaeota archaeon]
MNKIAKLISQKKIKSADCAYHTIRKDDSGNFRVLVLKSEPNKAYVEYKCGNCGKEDFKTMPWKKVSKAAMYRGTIVCDKCGNKMKIGKLKGGKKKKGA